MNNKIKHLLDLTWHAIATRKFRERVARHLLDQSRNEGDGDPRSNGEAWFVSRVLQLSKSPVPVLLDVGANIGDWSLMARSLSTRTIEVHAFEPTTSTFEALTLRTAKLSSEIKFTPHRFGLSDTAGPELLRTCHANDGSNSIHKRRLAKQTEGAQAAIEIHLKLGDAFVAECGLNRIDLLKIDTEGHEMHVLRGFARTLAAQKIDCIQFEYGGTWIDAQTYLHQAFDLLLPWGYVIARLHRNGIQIFDQYRQDEETFRYANYVAVRKDLVAQFKQFT
ncbi:MAG: FkbM family methyltransferase [Deltaproteobacteria bacterium]|nr:FkbM family methyltransferase [Deltaproteobacteria bacterium]